MSFRSHRLSGHEFSPPQAAQEVHHRKNPDFIPQLVAPARGRPRSGAGAGVSTASRRKPFRSRDVTELLAFTSIATSSPTTKSTSEPSSVLQ